MPIAPANRITGQESGLIAACVGGRAEALAHTLRLLTTIENIRLTHPSRPVLLELLEAYRDAVGDRHQAIASVCGLLRAATPPGAIDATAP